MPAFCYGLQINVVIAQTPKPVFDISQPRNPGLEKAPELESLLNGLASSVMSATLNSSLKQSCLDFTRVTSALEVNFNQGW